LILSAPVLIDDPAAVARRALAAVAPASGPVVVHFDVHMVDSGDLPLANFPIRLGRADGRRLRANAP
jgi:hypothetical protein